MKTIHKITMLLGAMAFAATACTNSDNEPDYGEITLTTPVVQLADIQATASRTNSFAPNNEMKLNVELLKQDGTPTDREAEYTYNGSAWGCTTPLTVTGGAGYYNARALASTVNVGEVIGAFYSFNGNIIVADDGSFTISEMSPLTTAIKVVLKDADGNEIFGTDLEKYKVQMTGVQKVTSVSWSDNGDATLIAEACTADDAKAQVYGYYQSTTINASASLLTVAYTDNSTNPVTTTAWDVKNGNSSLTIDKGKFYTFTITLGGSSSLNITLDSGSGSGNGISGFEGSSGSGTGNDINIGR